MKKFLGLVLAIVMAFSLASCGNGSTEKTIQTQEEQEKSTVEEMNQSSEESTPELSNVDAFIEQYNRSATVQITDTVEIDVTNRESGHYRTEFRLGAFSDSEARTGKIGNITMDIVCYGINHEDIRIYADGIELEQAKDIVKNASPILDDKLMDADISEVLEYLDTNKEANGYYFGDIGMTFIRGNLMLKVE